MILALVLAAHLQDKALFSKVELAYTCRYYKPGKAKSRIYLYLTNGDGSNRRKLPTVREPWNVRWIGRDRLEWVEYDREFETAYRMTSKVFPWKPISLGRLTGGVSENDLPKDCTGIHGVFELPNGEKAEVRPDPSSGEYVLNGGYGEKEQFLAGVEFLAQANLSWACRHASTGTIYFAATFRVNTIGNPTTLFSWNERNPAETVKCLFEGAQLFDLEPTRDYYAWVHHRDTAPLDPKKPDGKQVWVGAVGVGSQKLGKRVFPVSGVAWATSVAIRPNQ